jgi:hypothetical protein
MRIIDTLRYLYGGKWTYDRKFNLWNGPYGWHVYPVSQMAPRYDGDDDSFITCYRRSDTGALVEGVFRGWLVKNAH